MANRLEREVIHLAGGGMKLREVAAHCGIALSTASAIMTRNGYVAEQRTVWVRPKIPIGSREQEDVMSSEEFPDLVTPDPDPDPAPEREPLTGMLVDPARATLVMASTGKMHTGDVIAEDEHGITLKVGGWEYTFPWVRVEMVIVKERAF